MDDDAGARAQQRRDRQDGLALAAAQRLLDAGRVDEALAALSVLGADPTTAVRAHAAVLHAGVLLMAGRAADALDVLACVPERPTFPFDEGTRRMIEACALRQARRYADALRAARLSVAQGTTPGRLLVLADAQKHAGHLDDASLTLESLLARDPDNATALAQLAGYKNLLGADTEAATLLEQFRACADGSADARRNEAFIHATRGDLDATLAALAAALRDEPDVTRGYIADEIELDRFRAAPQFIALVGRIERSR